MNNIKQGRISSQVMREVSNILLLEAKDETLKHVTVTGCEVTNDLSYAKIYFTVLDDSKRDITLKALNQSSGFIRNALFDRIEIRHMPKLEFIYDDSIEYGKEIEDKIKELHSNDEKNTD